MCRSNGGGQRQPDGAELAAKERDGLARRPTKATATGAEYIVPKKPFALCRCGQSKEKPFCDSSHKLCNFEAAEAAPGPKKMPEPPATPPATS